MPLLLTRCHSYRECLCQLHKSNSIRPQRAFLGFPALQLPLKWIAIPTIHTAWTDWTHTLFAETADIFRPLPSLNMDDAVTVTAGHGVKLVYSNARMNLLDAIQVCLGWTIRLGQDRIPMWPQPHRNLLLPHPVAGSCSGVSTRACPKLEAVGRSCRPHQLGTRSRHPAIGCALVHAHVEHVLNGDCAMSG